MKRMLLMSLLALALPMTAFGSTSIDFTNSGGSLTGSSAGLSLTGSVLIAVNGFDGLGLVTGSNLGSVTFSTGALASGSIQMGGTFAAGGTFTITGCGCDGLPSSIFSGTFDSPVTWTMVTLANGTHNYTLTGSLTGIWAPSGATVFGATVQLTINTGKGFFNGSTKISSGDTNIVATPEPGTLGLLGTGLVGLAGAVRRKLKS